MLTMEALKEFGADTEKGLAVCMGNEALYLRLVGAVPTESKFDALSRAIGEGNLDEAFDAAHALKGVLGNLSLIPLYDIASEITEFLRNRTDMDYSKLIMELLDKRDSLAALCK